MYETRKRKKMGERQSGDVALLETIVGIGLGVEDVTNTLLSFHVLNETNGLGPPRNS